LISKTKAVKSIKVLDPNFGEHKRRAVHLGTVITKLGQCVSKTSKTLESFKKSTDSVQSAVDRAKEVQIKAQQNVIRKMKTQTKTLTSLGEVVLGFAQTVEEPLKSCKKCPNHCLFGLSKALPCKTRLSKCKK